ncbi:hypothetical protein [Mesorhizobium sp. M0586]|uniref:hypothetical protein n=1 Tax=unclassified Mesorhizobium TaxID=325217 RepID=UPI00333B1EFB
MKALLHQQMGLDKSFIVQMVTFFGGLLHGDLCFDVFSQKSVGARHPAPWQSRGHSAHIGQEVEVYYRWHPYFGRRLRCENSEERANGRIIHLVVVPGHVITALAWMVDPVVARQWAWAPRAYRLPRCLSFTCS